MALLSAKREPEIGDWDWDWGLAQAGYSLRQLSHSALAPLDTGFCCNRLRQIEPLLGVFFMVRAGFIFIWLIKMRCSLMLQFKGP